MDEAKKSQPRQRIQELAKRVERAWEQAKDAQLLALRLQLSSQQLRAVDVAVSAMDDCFTGGEL